MTRARCHNCRCWCRPSARGLCRPCQADPQARRDFPPPGELRDPALPEWPTAELPGSPGKVLVLMERRRRRRGLWHPRDARPASLPDSLGVLALIGGGYRVLDLAGDV